MTAPYLFTMTQRADGMDQASMGDIFERSRNGASCKLARTLVEKGNPDGPVHLVRSGVTVLVYNSLHALAQKTFTEATGRPRMIKWTAHPSAEANHE